MTHLDLSLYFNHCLITLLLFLMLMMMMTMKFYNFFLISSISNNIINNNVELSKDNFKQFYLLHDMLKS